jgi:hypothetical protein
MGRERLARYSLAGPEIAAMCPTRLARLLANFVGLADGRFGYSTGEALGAPVLADIRTYPTKVIDGTVYIEVG